ncbi:hypothetical protein CN507_17870 [Bacillus cereus]|nr:hypothetical protein CN507_17870 [Bacillus cereus]
MNPPHISFDWRGNLAWQMIQYLIYSSFLYVTVLIHIGYHLGILLGCILLFFIGVYTHILATPKSVQFDENGSLAQKEIYSTYIPYTSINLIIPISHPHSSISTSFEIRDTYAKRLLVLHDLTKENQQVFYRALTQKNSTLSNNTTTE